MAKVFTIPGQLPWHSKERGCVVIGLSQVNLYFCSFTRFHVFLKGDHKFHQQIERLLTDEPINIEVDNGMTHHAFVAFLPL